MFPRVQFLDHEHLGLILDEKLNSKEHLKEKMSKAYKGMAVLRKLQNIIPRNSLLTICKSFIHPPLEDYGDTIYHQPNNRSLCQKIESIQHQAALAITGAIHGTSQTKLYNELGIESMKLRQWFRCLLFFQNTTEWFTSIFKWPYPKIIYMLYNTFFTSSKF